MVPCNRSDHCPIGIKMAFFAFEIGIALCVVVIPCQRGTVLRNFSNKVAKLKNQFFG